MERRASTNSDSSVEPMDISAKTNITNTTTNNTTSTTDLNSSAAIKSSDQKDSDQFDSDHDEQQKLKQQHQLQQQQQQQQLSQQQQNLTNNHHRQLKNINFTNYNNNITTNNRHLHHHHHHENDAGADVEGDIDDDDDDDEDDEEEEDVTVEDGRDNENNFTGNINKHHNFVRRKNLQQLETSMMVMRKKLRTNMMTMVQSNNKKNIINNNCIPSNFDDMIQTTPPTIQTGATIPTGATTVQPELGRKSHENSDNDNNHLNELNLTQPAKYSCPICHIVSLTQHDFTDHIRSHNNTDSDSQNFTCPVCFKVLSSSSSLDRHSLVHTGERPFTCKYCNVTFTTNGNMHRHIRTHKEHKSKNSASGGNGVGGVGGSSSGGGVGTVGGKIKIKTSTTGQNNNINNNYESDSATSTDSSTGSSTNNNYGSSTTVSHLMDGKRKISIDDDVSLKRKIKTINNNNIISRNNSESPQPPPPVPSSLAPQHTEEIMESSQPQPLPLPPPPPPPPSSQQQTVPQQQPRLCCPLCPQLNFTNLATLGNHLDLEHPSIQAQCRYCEIVFKSHKALNGHKCAVGYLYGKTGGIPATGGSVNHLVTQGFKDMTFVDFSSEKFPLIAQSMCEQSLRMPITNQKYVCSICYRAFPCASSVEIHSKNCGRSPVSMKQEHGYNNNNNNNNNNSTNNNNNNNNNLHHNEDNSPKDFTINNRNRVSSETSDEDIRRNDFFAHLDLQNKSQSSSILNTTLTSPQSSDSSSIYHHRNHVDKLLIKNSTSPRIITTNSSDTAASPITKLTNTPTSNKQHIPLLTPQSENNRSHPLLHPLNHLHQIRSLYSSANNRYDNKDLADIQSIIKVTSSSGEFLQEIDKSITNRSLNLPSSLSMASSSSSSSSAAASASVSASASTSAMSQQLKTAKELSNAAVAALFAGAEDEEIQDAFTAEFRRMKLRGEFPCKLCDAVFPNLRALKGHNRLHVSGSGAGPFRCNMCPYLIHDKAALTRHMRTHNGDRPYECSICNYAFTTKANCERHLRNRHNKSTREEVKRSIIYHPSEDSSCDDPVKKMQIYNSSYDDDEQQQSTPQPPQQNGTANSGGGGGSSSASGSSVRKDHSSPISHLKDILTPPSEEKNAKIQVKSIDQLTRPSAAVALYSSTPTSSKDTSKIDYLSLPMPSLPSLPPPPPPSAPQQHSSESRPMDLSMDALDLTKKDSTTNNNNTTVESDDNTTSNVTGDDEENNNSNLNGINPYSGGDISAALPKIDFAWLEKHQQLLLTHPHLYTSYDFIQMAKLYHSVMLTTGGYSPIIHNSLFHAYLANNNINGGQTTDDDKNMHTKDLQQMTLPPPGSLALPPPSLFPGSMLLSNMFPSPPMSGTPFSPASAAAAAAAAAAPVSTPAAADINGLHHQRSRSQSPASETTSHQHQSLLPLPPPPSSSLPVTPPSPIQQNNQLSHGHLNLQHHHRQQQQQQHQQQQQLQNHQNMQQSSLPQQHPPPPPPTQQQQQHHQQQQQQLPPNNQGPIRMVIKNGVLMPKQKQRRYRTERPFACDHCSARFTLRSNMERHIKQQHPQFWAHRQRSGQNILRRSSGGGSSGNSTNAPSSQMQQQQQQQVQPSVAPPLRPSPSNQQHIGIHPHPGIPGQISAISDQVKYAILAQHLKTHNSNNDYYHAMQQHHQQQQQQQQQHHQQQRLMGNHQSHLHLNNNGLSNGNHDDGNCNGNNDDDDEDDENENYDNNLIIDEDQHKEHDDDIDEEEEEDDEDVGDRAGANNNEDLLDRDNVQDDDVAAGDEHIDIVGRDKELNENEHYHNNNNNNNNKSPIANDREPEDLSNKSPEFKSDNLLSSGNASTPISSKKQSITSRSIESKDFDLKISQNLITRAALSNDNETLNKLNRQTTQQQQQQNNHNNHHHQDNHHDEADLASVSKLVNDATNSQIKFGKYFRQNCVGENQSIMDHSDEEGLVASGSASESNHSGTEEPNNSSSVTVQGKKKSAYSLAPNRVSCQYCQRMFPWSSSLRRHILTHTGRKPFKCSQCPLLFTTKSNCDRHLLRKHGDVESAQSLYVPSEDIPLDESILEHRRHRVVVDDSGDERAVDEPIEINDKPNDEEIQDTEEVRPTISSPPLQEMPISPASTPPPPPSQTILSTQSPQQPQEEQEQHQESSLSPVVSVPVENELPLSSPPSYPEQPQNLQKPLFTTSGGNINETINSSSQITSGLPIISSDLPFKCHLCDGSFSDRIKCLKHIEAMHSQDFSLLMSKGAFETDPSCVNDQQGTSTASAEDDDGGVGGSIGNIGNNTNKQEHRGKYPDYANRKVMCAFCMRRFWSTEDLRRHMRTHSGERPFQCNVCMRKFTLKHSMLRHQKKHTHNANNQILNAVNNNSGSDISDDDQPIASGASTDSGGGGGGVNNINNTVNMLSNISNAMLAAAASGTSMSKLMKIPDLISAKDIPWKLSNAQNVAAAAAATAAAANAAAATFRRSDFFRSLNNHHHHHHNNLQNMHRGGDRTDNNHQETELIGNLLGISDQGILNKVLLSSADEAAKLLGVDN